MIVPEIYKSEPRFLAQSQYNNQQNILATILQKLENLEKKETGNNLPANLKMLILCLNDKIDELAKKQLKMDKVINDLLAKIDNSRKKQGTSNGMVSSPLINHPPQETNPISFAEIATIARNMNESTLPKNPPPAIFQNKPQEFNRFKKYHIVIH
ncbi:hypothetical protein O181_077350 [Austropuccinia psidii MF-1]|uniref:Uncharacterized protein n=1 Tax=Austropuccinia psidii MF-1 TaxID=1389203 RepID=A0A9Q3FHT4_9BASI|nr:hypothetical protein [Austropuccinia psidii MF-1]